MRYDPFAPKRSPSSRPIPAIPSGSPSARAISTRGSDRARSRFAGWAHRPGTASTPSSLSRLVAYVDDERFRNGVVPNSARTPPTARETKPRSDRKTPGRHRSAPGQSRDEAQSRSTPNQDQAQSRPPRWPATHRPQRSGRSRLSFTSEFSDPRVRAVWTPDQRRRPAPRAATVDVLDADSRDRLLGTVQTGLNGGFSYRLKATRSRGIRFRYHGSRRIGAAETVVRILVPAASTIQVDRSTVPNGDSVLFTGRVRTGPIPTAGEAHRGSGLLPTAVENVLDGPFRLPRAMGVPIRVRRDDRSRALPLPSASAGRGWLPVRHGDVASQSGFW